MARQYKIHTAYINTNGTVVPAGIYEEGAFSLPEARCKSVVTMVDATVSDSTTKTDEMPVQKFNEDSTELKPVEIIAVAEVKKIKPLKINSDDVTTIEALKYVSKKNAEDVVKHRAEAKFVSYGDLNTRVPLKFSRKWEDVTPIDFEEVVGHTTENSIYYSEGTVPLN